MASEVDICNLALANLGDAATVSSLSPPEGSIQAEHCARFYPIARDTLQEMHAWGFATKRVALAAVSIAWPQWSYAYAAPADAVNILEVLPTVATDDYSEGTLPFVPQPYAMEVDDQGRQIIVTDCASAVLRYTAQVSDPTKFTPLFVAALSWHLSSMLAGPIIKGDVGAAEAKRCQGMAQYYIGKAKESDANQRRILPAHVAPWIAGR